VTVYNFTQVLVWDNLGGSVKVARNQRVNVTDPSTGAVAPGLTVNGQPVSFVTSDSNGHVSFAATIGTVTLTGPNGFSMNFQSPDAYVQATQAAADAASSANSAAQSAKSAQDAANLVGAPAGSAIESNVGSAAVLYVAASGNDSASGKTWASAKATVAALAALPASAKAVIGPGTIPASANATIACQVEFLPGAVLSVAAGVTLTFTGKIVAGDRAIFADGGGTVQLTGSVNEWNLGWFSSGNNYINARWNFARRGMVSFTKKIVRIPHPYSGQPGTVTSGSRIYWLFDDQILFEDAQNSITVFVDGEFQAAASCGAFININHPAKPENIYFYGDVQAIVPPSLSVTYGIVSSGTARLTFYGNVVLNGFRTGVQLGTPGATNGTTDVRFFQLQVSFFYVAAVALYGASAGSVQGVQIDRLSSTAAQVAGLNVVEIRGLIRNVRFGDVNYSTDIAKNGYVANDAANVVYIESNSQGTIYKVRVDGIYQANATQALKITTDAGAPQTQNAIQWVLVENIYAKFNGVAADVNYCIYCRIRGVFNSADVAVGSTAYYLTIDSGAGLRTVNDSGNYTLINGLGKQSRGAGVAPAPTLSWPVGTHIRETSDGKVYLRVGNAGAASDFIALN
jgi:hypothetical protein